MVTKEEADEAQRRAEQEIEKVRRENEMWAKGGFMGVLTAPIPALTILITREFSLFLFSIPVSYIIARSVFIRWFK